MREVSSPALRIARPLAARRALLAALLTNLAVRWSTILPMPAALIRSEQPRWPWIAAVWSGIGLFDATQTVFVMPAEGMHHAWSHLFISLLLSWLPWALATPLVLRLGRQYPPAQWRRFSTWGAHIGFCAIIGLVYGGWGPPLRQGPYTSPESLAPGASLPASL